MGRALAAHWLRSPLLQFLVGGALLFRAVHGPHPFAAAARGDGARPIVVSAAEVARMREDYTKQTGLDPGEAGEAALVDQAIDEEVLYREARARGLDRNDRSVRSWLVEQARVLADDALGPSVATASEGGSTAAEEELYQRALELGLDRKDLVVRRILVQKMRLLASRVGETEATDAELRAFYEREAETYRVPARVTLSHVFFSDARPAAGEPDGPSAGERARRTLLDVRTGRIDVSAAIGRGDSFALPARLVAWSPAHMEKLFGGDVTATVMEAAAGVWTEPIPGIGGVHLFLIEERHAGGPPAFGAVRGRLREAWLERQRKERVTALRRELRARQSIIVESAAWNARPHS
jgi:hypothetical protein